MGSPDAHCYLASPAVVAASAVSGFIRGPATASETVPERRLTRHPMGGLPHDHEIDDESRRITGRLVVFLRDGIDSDALCPAHLVYDDNASRAELARAAFGSIDPAFAGRLRPGDVLVAGLRFGIGSSREQAVTALAASGIKAVVAESLAPAFKRNAWNNGFAAVERPDLVRSMRARYPAASRAAEFTEEQLAVDLAWLPRVARELIAAGGMDAFLRDRREHGGA
jgi:homoaconitate hydratase